MKTRSNTGCALAAVLPLVFLPASASAQSAVVGAGTAKCGAFGELYSLSPEQAEFVFFSWAQGYLSGLNIAAIQSALDTQENATEQRAREAGALDLSVMDEKAQFRHLTQFCDQRPLAMFMDAIIDLRNTLINRQRPEQ